MPTYHTIRLYQLLSALRDNKPIYGLLIGKQCLVVNAQAPGRKVPAVPLWTNKDNMSAYLKNTDAEKKFEVKEFSAKELLESLLPEFQKLGYGVVSNPKKKEDLLMPENPELLINQVTRWQEFLQTLETKNKESS